MAQQSIAADGPVPKGLHWLRWGGSVWARALIECILLGIVALAPWAFGAVDPEFESLLYLAVAAIVGLWGASMLLRGEFSWPRCPVAFCLAGLFLLGVCQLTPVG